MRGDVSGSAENRISGRDFRIIAAVAYRESGIMLPESKSQFVYSRLIKRVRILGLGSFRDYCALLQSDRAGEELPNLVCALTTNVTRFQREAHHTSHLRDQVLPPLVKRAIRGSRVRIWSAACSTGEEAYEIAFQILDICPEATKLDIRILATDIDSTALSIAQLGEYAPAALQALPEKTRRQYFLRAGALGEQMTVANGPKRLVTFRPLNLVRPWPVKGPFDAVFCRNVAIYFDPPTQESLWVRFAEVIPTEGVLYIGHSERILGPAAALFKPAGVTTFTRLPSAAGESIWAGRAVKGTG